MYSSQNSLQAREVPEKNNNKRSRIKERIQLISGITVLSTLALIGTFPRSVLQVKDKFAQKVTDPSTIGENASKVLREIILSENAQEELQQEEISIEQEQKNVEILRLIIVLEHALQESQMCMSSIQSNDEEQENMQILTKKTITASRAINHLLSLALNSQDSDPSKKYICDVCQDGLHTLQDLALNTDDLLAYEKMQRGLDRIKSTATAQGSEEFAEIFTAQREELCTKYKLTEDIKIPQSTGSDPNESAVYVHYFKKMLRRPTELFDEGR